MSFTSDYLAEYERKRAQELAEAERRAFANGKEIFDIARLEELLNRGPQRRREKDHRVNYYLMHPELTTLEAYATYLVENEHWEDTP